MLRWIFTTLVILLALLFWYMALTVPMGSASAPTIIAIALSISAYFVWPKNRKVVKEL